MASEVKQNEEIQFNPKSLEGRLHYSGSTKGGKPDGIGTMLWNNGKKYTGDWEDGLMDGYGYCKFENESAFDFYEGHCKNGKWSGEGTQVWKMDQTMLESGKMAKNQAKEHMSGKMETTMKVNGRMVRSQVKELSSGKMEQNILAR